MSRGRSHFIQAFRHAFDGIKGALRRERHMRFHFAAAIVVVILAAWLQVGRMEWLWLLAAITGVWVSELLNTAIERAVDLATTEVHPLAKAAKDTAAGAVLVAAFFAAVVGFIILGPPLWEAIFDWRSS
ncbi:diacylglycerol kinase family protein [Cohnella sp.]|uniref:diacylglycerol kinase family protein n=1 Tax=Cohnella sp. TaxID=1883426 RepID=UPI0035655463